MDDPKNKETLRVIIGGSMLMDANKTLRWMLNEGMIDKSEFKKLIGEVASLTSSFMFKK